MYIHIHDIDPHKSGLLTRDYYDSVDIVHVAFSGRRIKQNVSLEM